eukprot:274089-Amphidinium_carterae.1
MLVVNFGLMVCFSYPNSVNVISANHGQQLLSSARLRPVLKGAYATKAINICLRMFVRVLLSANQPFLSSARHWR